MNRRSSTSSRATLALTLTAALSAPSVARALEPLDVLVASARRGGLDAREARAVAEQRDAEVTAATMKLLPVLGAQGKLSRNQFEAKVGDKTIIPLNQADLYLTASVALVDVGQWMRIGAARVARDAAGSRARATDLDVERAVTRQYYQVVAAEAVRAAADRSLDAAQKNLAFVEARKRAGFAQDLDARRAEAEVARCNQLVADATYQVAVARRALETSTGRRPGDGAPALTADLGPEAPLATWEQRNLDAHPAVRAAADETRAAERTATATSAALLPTITLDAQERLTNATGFQDKSSVYTLSATLAVRFDVNQLAAGSALARGADVTRVREERARIDLRDRVHAAWHLVRAQIDKARAARAGFEASRLAAATAKQRYEAGTATFLDVVTSERDMFQAEVSRIQADGDLLVARTELRAAAGERPSDERRTP